MDVVLSMTGYGRAELSRSGISCSVEVRSVNSRFLEVVSRLPRSLSHRESDVKEVVRSRVSRGKISLSVTLEKEPNGDIPLSVNAAAARSYYKLLNQLRKAVRIREQVKLEHLLKFSEVLEATDAEESDEAEWEAVRTAIGKALDDLNAMRGKEGGELALDLEQRVRWMGEAVDKIDELSRQRIPEERKRLQERVAELLADKSVVDQNRLELEVILLAERLDVTEECVRFRSHTKFFLEAMKGEESAGRKLNFLVQEINREANTIGSKSNDAEIAHLVVRMKEELEKVREQLQNIE
ncbi:MAG: YicC family protein [Ignavibacteriales bacterium]|nr:YicC family protein [Ignavibacteriales bacterium]